MTDSSVSSVLLRSREQDQTPRWLLLIHQLPAEPAYLRVKILRRLKGIGAVALKNSVYLLPDREACREDLQWVRREITGGGGTATLSATHFLEGTSDDELEEMFRRERDEEYADLATAATEAAAGEPTRSEVDRLRRRLDEIGDRDSFGAPGRTVAEQALAALEMRIRGTLEEEPTTMVDRPAGATWVTRSGVYVDRMASAWLIRRFIDPGARFRFVPATGYVPGEGEIPFDMFEGGFTHEGDRCTFETLAAGFALHDPALTPIGEIVHEIDCKDGKYQRPETPGIASVLRGIAAAHPGDEDRIAEAAHLFDALLARFRGR